MVKQLLVNGFKGDDIMLMSLDLNFDEYVVEVDDYTVRFYDINKEKEIFEVSVDHLKTILKFQKALMKEEY